MQISTSTSEVGIWHFDLGISTSTSEVCRSEIPEERNFPLRPGGFLLRPEVGRSEIPGEQKFLLRPGFISTWVGGR